MTQKNRHLPITKVPIFTKTIDLVKHKGFEPLTFASVAQRSIQLS